jgi:DNA primase large subunit
MQGVLNVKIPLEGSEGHAMRVAIAVEAWNIGLSVEQAIELFKDQVDFDKGIARRHIIYVYARTYHPYSCDKLKEQCKSLVDPYCVKCTSLSHASI